MEMKKLILVLSLIFMSGTILTVDAEKKEARVVCFRSSMDCEDCEKTITEHVKFEKGVKAIETDYVSNTIKITYTEGKNTDEKLAQTIIKKGYKAEKISEEVYKNLIEKAGQK